VADNSSGMIKIALFGGAAFLAYKQGWLSSILPAATPAASCPTGQQPIMDGSVFRGCMPGIPPAGGATAPIVPTVPAAGPSLDSLGTQLVTAAAAQVHANPAWHQGPDELNSLLMQIYPGVGQLPAPEDWFAASGWKRPDTMTFANYWAVAAPWLRANKGLSGIGRHGLGFLYAGGR
jgi:hypothetical protein